MFKSKAIFSHGTHIFRIVISKLFSVNVQINMFRGVARNMFSVTATQFCHCNVKASMDNIK